VALLGVHSIDPDTSTSGSLLEILSPADLRNQFKDSKNVVNGFIENQPALFGNPMGGGEKETAGSLVYDDSTDPNGCAEFNASTIAEWKKNVRGSMIILADRGTCYFVEKVKHAENAGAIAAIIVDNRVEPGIPFMADYNNQGQTINIPSVLIHKDDGQKIKNFIKDHVHISMRWNLPHPDNRVEWDFWTSSYDTAQEANFKKVFETANTVLGKNALFTPHYVLDNPPGCRTDESKCKPACTNAGRYCSFTGNKNLTGAAVVQENLRQICIYNKTGDKWWTYVNKFATMCKNGKGFTKECSEECMKQCGIDANAVNDCVVESGGSDTDADTANWRLDAEISPMDDLGAANLGPTIWVNNMPYRGSMVCHQPLDRTCGVLAMICLGFKDATVIPACSTSPGCPLGKQKNECNDCNGDIVKDACGSCLKKDSKAWNKTCTDCNGKVNGTSQRDACGKCYEDPKDPRRIDNKTDCKGGGGTNGGGTNGGSDTTFPTWGVVLIVVGCVGVVAGGVYYFMKRREEAMREDIDKLLAQYINLDSGAQPLN
jgi:hypothetical protein